MSKYKLIALDMDGTLLTHDHEISPENRQWLKNAQDAGILISLATGRGYQSAATFVHDLQLDTPMVFVNGGEVWKNIGELYKRELMRKIWIAELREMALRYDTWYWAYSLAGVHNKENWSGVEQQDWLKFGFYTENHEALGEIRKQVEEMGLFEISNSHPSNLEINPRGVHKASGLEKVCAYLNIGMDQVVTMGDSLNDLEMIRQAGLGIAMGNAQEIVKEAADYTTKTNEEHGVAHAIRQWVLEA